MEWQVPTAADTAAAAVDIVRGLTPARTATVLALHGDLGAGKTTFVQALAHALGVGEPVTSPTFVIRKDYTLSGAWDLLVHIDAYRLDEPTELERLGFSELLSLPRTLICIEWAERVADILPPTTNHLSFTILSDQRIISLYHAEN
ncbi:MAG TPA: tRNA (adenosine(37)-N6)-threonylcarbamoyltransferase complex ATPase subunit type 1 TsaE [Candidatus Paceibacterota bacterium]|nr:tRNA (adenosine(37)-N6)-threonylcarbamoyltransferase complex ATPase subunit type 1 TsaE [Candidatus Paceibacterota bacterium]